MPYNCDYISLCLKLFLLRDSEGPFGIRVKLPPRTGIEPESTVSEADALFTRPLIGKIFPFCLLCLAV